MTAAAAVSRPTLYLVPGLARGRSAPPAAAPPPVPLAVTAGVYASRSLGTLFAPAATRLARALGERAPLLVRQGRAEVWAAAIVFLLAEEARLFEFGHGVTRTSFAREVGSTLPTLRRRAAAIRTALHPLAVDLPEPDGGFPCEDTS